MRKRYIFSCFCLFLSNYVFSAATEPEIKFLTIGVPLDTSLSLQQDQFTPWLGDGQPPYVSSLTGAFFSEYDAEQARKMAQILADEQKMIIANMQAVGTSEEIKKGTAPLRFRPVRKNGTESNDVWKFVMPSAKDQVRAAGMSSSESEPIIRSSSSPDPNTNSSSETLSDNQNL